MTNLRNVLDAALKATISSALIFKRKTLPSRSPWLPGWYDHLWRDSRASSETVKLCGQCGWAHHSSRCSRCYLTELRCGRIGASGELEATLLAVPDSNAPSFDRLKLASSA